MIVSSPALRDLGRLGRLRVAPRWRPFVFALAAAGFSTAAFSSGFNFDVWRAHHPEAAPLGPYLLRAAGFARLPELEDLNIDIGFRSLGHLQALRAEAVRISDAYDKNLGTRFLATDAYKLPVSAKLQHRGRIIPAAIRLKGATIGHYRGPKWSIRVSVPSTLTKTLA